MQGIAAIITALARAIYNIFAVGIPAIVTRVLSAFGLTLLSVQTVLPELKSFLQGFMTAMPSAVLQLMGALGVDVAMSMVISALSVKLAWKVFIVPKALADQLS